MFLRSFKMEDDGDFHKTLVKLRRTPCDAPRPASTPPVIAASAVQDDEDDEEKIIAELQVPICVVHVAVISCLCHILSYVNQRRFSLQKVVMNAAAAAGTPPAPSILLLHPFYSYYNH